MTDAYNEVRDDLIKLGILWRDSKLDKVQCFYEPIAPYSAVTGRMGYFDFAETFTLFVKHKGKLPAPFKGKPVILKKWKAVAEIVKRVAAAAR